MKATVGPLPPAVYWQRRAALLAALVFILVMFATCALSGSGGAANRNAAIGSSSPSPSATETGPLQDGTPEHPFLNSPDPIATGSPTPSAASPSPQVPASPVSSPSPQVPVRTCVDADLALSAALSAPAWKAGTMPHMELIVRNTSKVSCTRDLGATQQELRVMQGAARIWSSDDCQPTSGVAQKVLAPGQAQVFKLTWSGKSSVPNCAKPRVQSRAGSYQLFARLGTLLSRPTPFTIT
jgi:hypothetical protein